jgi:hydroxymethylbilane synthase
MSNVIHIATRGSALALAQSTMVMEQCRSLFPTLHFELKIIKTTGDKLQVVNLADKKEESTKGLFTKELEIALLAGEAAFAVHSLKDLPTELPAGLHLGAVSKREDVRDVLIFRDQSVFGAQGYSPHTRLSSLKTGAVIATGSTRRQAQLLALRPDLKPVPIRGNVGTRIRKLVEQTELHAIILALAGLKRLGYTIDEQGHLGGKNIPAGVLATVLPLEEMLPCVGQAALGYECRIQDSEINRILRSLNDESTFAAVKAERAFLRAMGGGCLSPVAAHATTNGSTLHLSALSFTSSNDRRTEVSGPFSDPEALGKRAAESLVA